MISKTLAILALSALALAGCGSPAQEQAPMEPSQPVLTESQSMTDLLLPPTDAVVDEVPKGSLGVFTEDYAPQPALDTLLDVYLPEENK